MLWHTHPAAYSWTKKNSVCVEGFSLTDPDYVSAWTSACGNQTRTCTQDCSFTNNCAGVPVAQCIECWTTARVSAFSTWSTCNAITHKRTQTRTCTEDCDNGTESGECETYFASNCPSGSSCVTTGSGLSWTQTVTQDCRGTVSGTIYDASDASSCATMTTPINALGYYLNFSAAPLWLTTPSPIPFGSDGSFSFSTFSPGTYTPNWTNLYTAGLIGSTTPRFSCNGASITFIGSPTSCNTQPCETIIGQQNYGFWRQYDGWWQATGGPIYVNGTLGSAIPSSIALPHYLIRQGATAHKGFLFYGSSYDLGTNPSATINLADTRYQGTYQGSVTYNYDFFAAKYALNPSDATWNSNNLPAYNDVGGKGYMLIKYTGANPGTLSIAATSILAGRKYIALVPPGVGVSITGNITVASGGFLAIIADSGITFTPAVTAAQGWYLTDALLTVASTGNETTEQQFVGTGSFVGHGGIVLNRDRGVTNNTSPAETFTYSTPQLNAAPSLIKFPYKKYVPYNP